MDIWLYALLLSAIAVLGVTLLRKSRRKAAFPELNAYLASLSDLLKNKEEASIAPLLEALPLNSDTLETHLAFGEYLRRRGEVDKAVAVHNNIITARVSENSVNQATLALALDFRQSGLLDRAESLLKTLLAQLEKQDDGALTRTLRGKALNTLVDLYQDEREWESAIACIDDLRDLQATGSSKVNASKQAHFCCELALEAGRDGAKADRWLNTALLCDPNHVRAALLKNVNSVLASSDGSVKLFRSWEQLLSVAPEIWLKLDKVTLPDSAWSQLYDAAMEVFKKTDSLHLVAPTVKRLLDEGQLQEARALLCDTLARHREYRHFVSIVKSIPDDRFADVLEDVVAIMEPVLACKKCGFETAEFFWCCPTCKSWR